MSDDPRHVSVGDMSDDEAALARALRREVSSGVPFYRQHGGLGFTVMYRYVDLATEVAERHGFDVTNVEHVVSLGQGCHDSLTVKPSGGA